MINDEKQNLPVQRSAVLAEYSYDYAPVQTSDLHDFRDYLVLFFRRWRIMLVVLLAVVGSGMAYTLTRKPVYESVAKIVVTSKNAGTATENDVPILSDLQALTRSRSVDTQVEIISSPDLMETAYQRIDPNIQKAGFGSKSYPGWACSVVAKKNTDIITITSRAYTPLAATELANTVVTTFFERDLQENNKATRQACNYAREKMMFAAKQLSDANGDLAKFKQKTGLFAPDVQLTKTAEHAAQISLDLDTSKAEAASNKQEAESLQSKLVNENENVVSNTTLTLNPRYSAILAKIDSLNSERAALLQEYTPTSREVKDIENRIAQEEKQLKNVALNVMGSKTESRNQVREALMIKCASDTAAAAAGQARVNALESAMASQKAAAQKLPRNERVYADLIQRVTLLQRTYEMMSSKYYTLLLSQQSMIPNGMLVSKARPSGGPVSPNVRNNAVFFLLLGLLLAALAAAVTEKLDCRIHTQIDAEQLTGLASLSAVPETRKDTVWLASNNGHGAMKESYRILRNNISFFGVDRPIKVLAVTSACRNEGKSTTTVNLAVAMAMEGKRVLVVDCDLRRPTIHKLASLSSDIGLTTVVTGHTRLEEAIVPTNVPNVFCLPSGPIPPNPSELLNSHSSRGLFQKLVEKYDVVLLDCPPCIGLSDTQTISTLVDGMLLVVSLNQTLKPHLETAMKCLSQSKSPLLGMVINRVDTRSRAYSYYYGYYYQHDDSNDVSGKQLSN